MPTDPEYNLLQGEIKIHELSRRTRLMVLAKGEKSFSASEGVFLFVIAALMFVVLLNRASIEVGVFPLFTIMIVLQVLHSTRIHRRLKAIVELIELQERK